ncbi:ABC transporter ATP-binding protein [Paenibacillus senegalensis]|uniref:ABC transporter ATP-binding protein n=1 Tax=Paenibacillus senegalensis TaxID=1465766 RepID=UPI0002883B09|nr:ABC transporter ATP-binding protein [Paenibacillus senegalensis]
MIALSMQDVSLKYNGKPVIEHLKWQVEAGRIYSIIGPNGCGKSTLLKAIARQLKCSGGSVLVDGKQLDSFSPRQLARRLAMLAQSQDPVPDMSVRTLVGYGRFPHKPAWSPMRKEDEAIIDWALTQTGTMKFAERKLSALSGGERQKVWIAMALAQQPDVLLLDEPTTYLDIQHQLEIMELVASLNRLHKVTIIMVLHDMNHAAVYSDELAVMRKGKIYAQGKPEDTLTEQMLADVFGVRAQLSRHPESGRPVCLVTGVIGPSTGSESDEAIRAGS